MSRLVRSICAALCGAGALLGSSGANAQSVVLYGLMDVSAAQIKPVGGEAVELLETGGLQRSFLGFRGAEDLGGGLRAVFKLEAYLRPENGTVGRDANDAFFGRESSVGLSGAFGTTLLGRTVTPMFLTTVNYNPFGESAEFSPSTRQYFGSRGVMLGDSRWNNSINYTNNTSSSPLRLNAIGSLANLNGSPQPGPNWGGSASYITGPFAASLVYEKVKTSPQPLPAGFQHRNELLTEATGIAVRGKRRIHVITDRALAHLALPGEFLARDRQRGLPAHAAARRPLLERQARERELAHAGPLIEDDLAEVATAPLPETGLGALGHDACDVTLSL